MFKISVNDQLVINATKDSEITEFNNSAFEADIIPIDKCTYHLIHNYKSYTVEVVSFSREMRLLVIKVNGTRYSVTVHDEMDQLLQKLSMDIVQKHKALSVKAPMPGLVLDVVVADGEKINKGDAIMILEAMKMENVLKASEGGTVKKISVNKGDKVEKNQVMMIIE
jgi:biotin carboxyl carrier protein